MRCELCEFSNPKATITAIILRDNKLLVLKRNEEPFKGAWDLPGGYMNQKETPESAIRRELKEELGVEGIEDNDLILMREVPGYGYWQTREFPIIAHFYLIDIGRREIILNEENSEFSWISLSQLEPKNLAWDSNRDFCKWLKNNFTFDLERIKELIRQLDPSAIFNEQYLYKAALNGFISKKYDLGKLIGFGWIFPRQTLLRKQAIIEDMIVDDAYRGRGLGREILKDLLNWAEEKGMDTVELTTNPKRIAANELYKSEGFRLHETNHYLYNVPRI